MDYSKLSDFEINKRVANELKKYTPLNYPHDADKRSVGALCSDDTYCWYDYCNKPADAWPIIVKNLIEISPDYEFSDEKEEFLNPTGIWSARLITASGSFKRCEEENPLRAAMTVFLMMQEEKMNAHG